MPGLPVFLDRDGVINENCSDYVKRIEEWVPFPEVFFSLAKLTSAGHPLVVVTNQSAVARGYTSVEDVAEIHDRLRKLAEEAGALIEGIYYCPHLPETGCDCRKPATGMVDAARDELSLPEGGYLVGDAASDIQLGSSTGLKTILVLTGRGRDQLDKMRREKLTMPWAIAQDIAEAVELILADSQP